MEKLEKNFNLKSWKLQIPIATKKSVVEIYPEELQSDYTSKYFYPTTDSAIAFWCPSDGDITPNSKNPRSELREMPVSGWELTHTHVLSVECAVMQLPPTQKGIIIGQIHGTNTKMNPQLCKLYWGVNNKLTARIKNDDDPSCKQDINLPLGEYKLGERITYEIIMKDMDILVSITSIKNGVPTKVTKTASFKNEYWRKQSYYFKVGNYFQINTPKPVTDSLVYFYSIRTKHSVH